LRRLLLLLNREVRGFLVSPVFWLFVSLAWFITGLSFRYRILPGSGGDVSGMILGAGVLAIQVQLIFVPLLTMRTISEEKRTGTFEMLVTTPAKDHEIVLAKFLAVFLMNSAIWLIIPAYFLLLGRLDADPDPGVVLTCYVGVALVGGVFTAAGILASSTTQHQILAGFLGVVLLTVLLFLPQLTAGLGGPVGRIVGQMVSVGNLDLQLREAAAGLVDVVNLTYQLSLTAVLLLFSVRILEVRKWR